MKPKPPFLRSWRGLLLLLAFWLPAGSPAAEQYADISVELVPFISGGTYHGYFEIRLAVENHSRTRAHQVTLVYPDRSWHNGNSIGSIKRTLKLEPGARETVSLLQPPLPAQGNGSIRLEVDGRREAEIPVLNVNNHCVMNSRVGNLSPTVLVSRGVDFDAVEKMLVPVDDSFRPAKATGEPDARGQSNANTWMPDGTRSVRTNWLELDYAMPQAVTNVVVVSANQLGGQLSLMAADGRVLSVMPVFSYPPGVPAMRGRRFSPPVSDSEYEFAVPVTNAAVKTVRLDLDSAYYTAIDAVRIDGPAGSQWAEAARASSDYNATAISSGSHHSNPERTQSYRTELPVTQWSENWLGYSAFDAIVLGAADLRSLSPGVFAALGDYVYAGGNLIVLGMNTLPGAWHALATKHHPAGTEWTVGFGSVTGLASESPVALDAKTLQRVREIPRDNLRYWMGLPPDGNQANAVMPVVDNLKVPTRGIVVIMLAFIILIGPVNLMVLSRRNRRTWMLWTIPVISVATTLLVFVYSFLREGVTPDSRIAGITFIDQAAHRAATIGATAFYCPLTPSGGLRFDYGTEVTPLVQFGYGSGTVREMDWTQSQHLSRGWVSARVPAHFHLRKTETRRERLQIVSENGRLQVINSLGARVKSLWVADGRRRVYQAGGVGAGEKAALVPVETGTLPEASGLEGLLREMSFTAREETIGDQAGRFLSPDSYVAVLEQNPFIENGLGTAANARRTRSSAIVYGILEPNSIP